MDFSDTKYEVTGTMEEHELGSDHGEVSVDDPRQLSMFSGSRLNTSANKASSLTRSKYEMNLAEFPLSLLSKRRPKIFETIEYKDTITGSDGEPVDRIWRVKPSHDHGFGSLYLTSILFEIFQLWKEQGFSSRNIQFGSVYNLVQRLGVSTTDTLAYDRIRGDLSALVEITIEARNAFWDNEKKAYVTKIFHLFDSATLYHKHEKSPLQEILPFSYITASETLMQSVAANAIITLRGVEREWFHSLAPTQKRLALYLSKMLYKSGEHRRDVEKLAQQLPINAKTYKHTKYLLGRACDGLIKKQFPYLAEYRFEPSRRVRRENIIFVRKGTLPPPTNPEDEEVRAMYNLLVEDIIAVTGATDRREFYARAVRALPKENILSCLSLTNAAKQQHEIKKTPDRYFTGLILEYATQHGIHI